MADERGDIHDTLSNLKKQFTQIIIVAILSGAGVMVTFYFQTQAALQRHENDIVRIGQALDKKADNTQIEQINSDLKEVKSDVKDIYNLLIKDKK